MLRKPEAPEDSLEGRVCVAASFSFVPISPFLLSTLQFVTHEVTKYLAIRQTIPPNKLPKKYKSDCKSSFQPKGELSDAKEQERGDFIEILHPSKTKSILWDL